MSTRREQLQPPPPAAGQVAALTILAHADHRRVGERALLHGLSRGQPVRISRLEPAFATFGVEGAQPLRDPYLSRQPIVLRQHASGAIEIAPDGGGSAVAVNGSPLVEAVTVGDADLVVGVMLTFSDRLLLLLNRVMWPRDRVGGMGLVGESDALEEVRRSITKVAGVGVPVLLRGESGTGKELIAEAIHRASARKQAPWIAINMAALPQNLVAAELFGHTKGAFTSADRERAGVFARAQHGTLFLDEVGHMPSDVQLALLRVLEVGRYCPVGSEREEVANARIIAATDADLDGNVEVGKFSLPLYHRLSGFVIRVPPLRERRDDMARLAMHFLWASLQELGDAARLDTGADAPALWLPVSVMEQLIGYPWPGNVRQLRNVMRQIAIANHGESHFVLPAEVERLLHPAATSLVAAPLAEPRTRPAEIDEATLLAALEENTWRPAATARALGISRTSLYALMEQCTGIRKARDLSAEEIRLGLEQAGGDVALAAAQLRVSQRGLQLRMKELAL